MTYEELLEILEDDSLDEWDSPIPDRILEGLLLVRKYIPNKTIIGGANHDVIFGPHLRELIEAGLTREDAVQLRKWGWFEEYDCLNHFV